MQTSLTVIQGPDRGKRYEVALRRVTIGREVRNDISLHDSDASRRHAELLETETGYVLRDLQSSNGTYVNERKIESSRLQSGDRIRVGVTEMIFACVTTGGQEADLSKQIELRTGHDSQTDASAIVRSIDHQQGSVYLKHPELAGSPWLQNALSNLTVMYETSRAIANITDINQLLHYIMDQVFRSVRPDRGCIMLTDEQTQQLQPTVVKFGPNANDSERIALSQTIIDWALTKNEGVLMVDAPTDERFGQAQSVVRLGITEAICVPLRGRHDTLGVLYIDIRREGLGQRKAHQPTSKITEEHLKLLLAMAYQAGLAIEDSRFYQAMIQSERLAAVGQTIATLSHHIKNILQGVRSGGYLIEMGLNENNNDLARQGWGVLQKNQDRIYHLVMDMLSYSKDRKPAFEMVPINAVVKDLHELMQSRADDLGVQLALELDETLPEIAADEEGLHRAILNILTNAIDAANDQPDAKVTLKTSFDLTAGTLTVTVADNGVGIPPGQVEKIFQLFNSTKGSKGSGLGLAVSQKIVQEHGGVIQVESERDQGSQFSIILPLRLELPSSEESGSSERGDDEDYPTLKQ